ncbi:uncharacterized protein Tco025E_03603 [Trypanosoma conorhini]|uniref:RING-type domain-containing protein n=1 Tax=Trypanosoma conorhini TaxID=83891 RepID=A0A422PTX1_9TRYP|nr:uncharacterized protein Tco025E_03603 [Trypanosoma conorhini]RNF21160.1 hypothetical protein Tco025E_03603 [Trypanosoma conorhini]
MSSDFGVEALEVSAMSLLEHSRQLWQKIHALRQKAENVDKELFTDALHCSARCILGKLEASHAAADLWGGYLDCFTLALDSFGTVFAEDLLWECEDIFTALLNFPVEPKDLFQEYSSCLAIQQRTRKRTSTDYTAPTPPCPMLESMSWEVAVVPDIPHDEVRAYLDSLPPKLTFPLQRGMVLLCLSNPLPLPGANFVRYGFSCDTCHINNIQVGFQAVICGNGDKAVVRSEGRFSNAAYRIGFDICVGCAVYFYRDAVLRLSHAIEDCSRTFRVSPAADVKLHSFASEGNVAHLTVSFRPWGARPIVWIPKQKGPNPPADWRSAVRIESHLRYDPSLGDGGGYDYLCSICLQPLANDMAVLETMCGHCFHVDCAQEMLTMMDDRCPVCRRKYVFGTWFELGNRSNTYNVQFDCPADTTEFLLTVGALLTTNGEYDNPTNIAACRTMLFKTSLRYSFGC